jgi:hypothetical protein
MCLSDSFLVEQMIDTQAPLRLGSCEYSISIIYMYIYEFLTHKARKMLILDLLSVHLIRKAHGSTIISYHHELDDHRTTTAQYLHERIRFAGMFLFTLLECPNDIYHSAGQSVYWQSIFQKSSDPTFVLITFLWHALYAWDEALENLYKHICSLVRALLLPPHINTHQTPGNPRDQHVKHAADSRTPHHPCPPLTLLVSAAGFQKECRICSVDQKSCHGRARPSRPRVQRKSDEQRMRQLIERD